MSMPDGSYIIRYNVTPVSDKEYTYVAVVEEQGRMAPRRHR